LLRLEACDKVVKPVIPQPNRFSTLAAVLVTACSLNSLDDLKGESDAGLADQCLGECVSTGGTGGFGNSSGFGGSFGGSGGSDAGDAATDVDAASPCDSNDPDCQQCCVSATGAGATHYLQALHDCICMITSVCQNDCTTYCDTQQLDATCAACLNSSEVQQCLSTECSTTECKAYTACVAQC
jgi:hypothetical protein